MEYFEKDDLDLIFKLISKYYNAVEEVPQYTLEQAGVEKCLGILERVKTDFYPSLMTKTTYLFIQINKGHLFSNGNKRLALVTAMGFLNINNKKIAQKDKRDFKDKLLELFPKYKDHLEDQEDFAPQEYALYNLSIIVADSHKYIPENDFDYLKNKVIEFFNHFVVNY